MPSGVVTLLTDFGTKDPFVGVMKGVILTRHPAAVVVDLAHGVGAHDIVEGAFWLERCFHRFPLGTVHVAVIDPGVGSDRAAVAVEANGHWFVGPDNGLLAGICSGGEVRAISLPAIGVGEPSSTFHGRDVFAPAGAELARGLAFSAIGPTTSLAVGRPIRAPRVENGEVHGVVVSVDRFGNAITNIGGELVSGDVVVSAAGVELRRVTTYSDLQPGENAALVSSFDTVEIAQRGGDAASALGLRRGSVVVVRAKASDPIDRP